MQQNMFSGTPVNLDSGITPFDNQNKPTIALPPPASARTHQRSRTTVDLPPLFPRTKSSSPSRSSTFLPFLRGPSRSVSPERVSISEAAEFDLDAASSRGSSYRSRAAKVEKLASWFEGASDPLNITLVPSRKKDITPPVQTEAMEKACQGSPDPFGNLTRRPQKPSSFSVAEPPSRFNMFRRPSRMAIETTRTDDDELVALDIRDSLFPNGPVDEFSPSAFKNLQLNAEGLLRRYQSAYIEQQTALRSTMSAKNIQADELEAAETKNEYLKLQVIGMTERASEQERIIASLRAELSSGLRSTNTSEIPQCSIRKVSQASQSNENAMLSRPRAISRTKRYSDISLSGESEAGSDVSSVVSVFSDTYSVAESAGTSHMASPVMKHARMNLATLPPLKLAETTLPIYECQRCHGVNTSEAWDVITMMKEESSGLKERISQLEAANDDALGFLNGLQLM